MEVSSHALALRRVDETRFAAAVFTNLTRDHLDFHGDMESYFAAKRRLFEMLPRGAPAVVNLDDPRGAALASVRRRTITYAIDRPADVCPAQLAQSLRGLTFDVATPRGVVDVRLAARRPSERLQHPRGGRDRRRPRRSRSTAIEQGLAGLDGVPGRFEVVSARDDDVTVVVDYAHTDDALKNLLETARPLATGRLITVFGCGGDRDRTKRPLMGAVAARLSDLVILTSDNPRSEDPERIIEEIEARRAPCPPSGHGPAGRAEPGEVHAADHDAVPDDRRPALAIERAIALARPDDVVLIAGKGHERYQVIGDREMPFDDVGGRPGRARAPDGARRERRVSTHR